MLSDAFCNRFFKWDAKPIVQECFSWRLSYHFLIVFFAD